MYLCSCSYVFVYFIVALGNCGQHRTKHDMRFAFMTCALKISGNGKCKQTCGMLLSNYQRDNISTTTMPKGHQTWQGSDLS